MRKAIIITLQFPAVHRWENCSIESVAFLKNPHRHLFFVTIRIPVSHNDREIEFIDMKNKVEAYVKANYANKDLGTKSCEQIAEELYTQFSASYVSVLEDNENGSEIYE